MSLNFLKHALFLCFCFLAPRLALANACHELPNQNLINQCAQDEYRLAEVEWQKSFAQLNTDYFLKVPAFKTYIREWQKFRDDFCEKRAQTWGKGSAFSFIKHTCLTRFTKAKTKELSELTKDFIESSQP